MECERKLYKPSERNFIDVRFDTSVLLRADKASLAAYYNTLFNIGAITQNEIRQTLDMQPLADGDDAFIHVNMQPLKMSTQGTQAQQEAHTE